MTVYASKRPDIVVPDLSITELLFQGLAGRPSDVALIDGVTGRAMTCAELERDIRRLAGGLVARSLGQGHVIALMAPNMPEFAVVFHGIALAGGTLTTVNPSYTAEELRHQLRDSGAEVLITTPAFLETARTGITGTRVRELVVIGDAEGAVPLSALMGDPLPAQVPVDLARHSAVLPYSSGTTGLPKGVMLSHRNLVANILQVGGAFDVRAGDISVSFLPFFHIYGMQAQMNLYLVCRATLVTLPRFDLEAVLRLIQTHRIRGVMVVPPVILGLTKHPLVDQYDLSSLEWVLSAAAPLGADIGQACAARIGCAVVQGYGMTELSPVSHVVAIDANRPGSVGTAIGSTLCRIVDEAQADVPTGTEGELLIEGPQVMLGYLGNPEATARTLTPDGWLHTGDLARIDGDGYLFILDRVKELIKVKGFQVAPAELEALIVTHPEVVDVAVIGVPDDEAGEVPMAFVVRVAGSTLTEAQVIGFAGRTLAHFKHPRRVRFIDAIPKSPSGKIQRRLLRDMA